MEKSIRIGIALCAILSFSTCVMALDWTGVTIFGCDEQGTVDARFRCNSGPVDAAWDVFLYEGKPIEQKDLEKVHWLNHPQDHSIRVPLSPGVHAFTFHIENQDLIPSAGINLFFDGDRGRPAISARAAVAENGPPKSEFFANTSGKTMGWPITDVPGSGTLVYQDQGGGIHECITAAAQWKVTLKEFWIAPPTDGLNLDFVAPHTPGASGKPDWVGHLVLEVEESSGQPSDFFLWLQTAAGMTMGGPDHVAVWKEKYDTKNAAAPFSFTYGGKPSKDFLKNWQLKTSEGKNDRGRAARILVYTDPETGLQVRWQGVEYRDYQTVEWTLYFKNTGTQDTPILENILALDTSFSRDAAGEFQLHYNRGDFCVINSYEPLEKTLLPNEKLHLAPAGGRPTDTEFPYFNINVENEGLIAVLGWPGQWSANFIRDDQNTLTLQAGQELTHFKLLPGEEVRSPLVVLQFRNQGDWMDGQNKWRRWMKAYSMPKPGGKLQPPMLLASSSRAYIEMHGANTENQIMFIQRYLDEDMKLDYWWMDAGWYECGDPPSWPVVGTWEVDRKRFPQGFKPISDFAHKNGVKILVWFEPSRVHAGTWIAEKHPEWVYGGAGGGLLRLDNPEAMDWLVNHIDKLIEDNGIDLYREDFNIAPLGHWRGNDTPDRQGITEIRFVTNFLAYWDELIRRHPGLFIDTCASGGRRLDAETLRRGAPLWRSDYAFEPIGHQGQTYGLSMWLPYHGTGTVAHVAAPYYGAGVTPVQPYAFWSNSGISLTMGFDMRIKELDYDTLRKLFKQWRSISENYYGDYYPLTPYSLQRDAWVGWQFDRPEEGQGMVNVFRRDDCVFYGAQMKLRGLHPESRYRVQNLDGAETVEASGRDLMTGGVKVAIPEAPGAAILAYERIE